MSETKTSSKITIKDLWNTFWRWWLACEMSNSYERMQSSTAVAKFLNEKGITTKAGNKWNPSTVCLILRNPVYKGTMVYNKRRISVTGKLKP